MSKRSRRRKHREQVQKKAARLTGPVLVEQGKAAFGQANYGQAIETWQQARHKQDTPANLDAALAEAHFRRALAAPASALDDLQEATKLAPAEPRYRYHLALVHHRLNQTGQAEPLYRRLLAESPPFRRAAFPLAQLLLEKKQDIQTDPVWSQLDGEEQGRLLAVSALSQNKPAAALRHTPASQADSLWSGLAAVALKDVASARQELETALQTPGLHPLLSGVARYYLGLLAAQAGQADSALAYWQAAQNDGLDTPHLRRNLAILLYRQALNEQQAGHAGQALHLLAQSQSLDSADLDLTGLNRQLNLEAGYTAAQRGHWNNARQHWQAAQAAGDTSRRLVINLALAYEKLEDFGQAADLWREALRRRPRSASHPDALTDDQVARLWQHVAESYSKAGDYEQAITTYRNALKWAPDNVELQLDLIDALQAEGHWQAADNEIDRLLAKRPNYVPALTRRAESYEADGYLSAARQIWQKILELEPQHATARQQLAQLYEREGLEHLRWSRYKQALALFQEGLRYLPDNPMLVALIGTTYSYQDDFDQTRRQFEQALALDPGNLSVLHLMLLTWLDERQWQEVDRTLDAVKALDPPAPASFLLDLVHHCDVGKTAERAMNLAEFAERLYPDDVEVLMHLAWRWDEQDEQARAVKYLRRVLRQEPNHAEANLRLGTIYYLMDQRRLANRHWAIAEQQAHQENDLYILSEIQMTKNALLRGIPLSNNLAGLPGNLPAELADLLKNIPPEILANFLEEIDYD